MSDGEPEQARASEAFLFALLASTEIGPQARVWCISPGRGQVAIEVARAGPERKVTLTYLDQFQCDAARVAAGGREGIPPPNLVIECLADLPRGPFDVALLPMRAGADSEVAWEMLQHAYVELAVGGRLISAVDEPRDHWLAGRMDALFGRKVRRDVSDEAIAYGGTKRGELKKVKEFACDFAFRDRGKLIAVVSRPGVFSHRRLDLGARALIESLDFTEENGLVRDFVASGMRVLDYGCGAGAVGIAAALRADDVAVHFVDSMARAVACSLQGAAKNGLANCTGEVSCDGRVTGAATFDLALLNPPYYSHFRIAELFVAAARDALRRGGRVHLVTKQPEWFLERLPRDFDKVATRQLRGYEVVTGTRK